MIDIGKKDFSSGLTYVACSRVRCLKDLSFATPFPYTRLANLEDYKSVRIKEDHRLKCMQQSLTSLNVVPQTSSVDQSIMPPFDQSVAIAFSPVSTPSPTSKDTPSPVSMNTPSPISMNTPSPTSVRTPSPTSKDTLNKCYITNIKGYSITEYSITYINEYAIPHINDIQCWGRYF